MINFKKLHCLKKAWKIAGDNNKISFMNLLGKGLTNFQSLLITSFVIFQKLNAFKINILVHLLKSLNQFLNIRN